MSSSYNNMGWSPPFSSSNNNTSKKSKLEIECLYFFNNTKVGNHRWCAISVEPLRENARGIREQYLYSTRSSKTATRFWCVVGAHTTACPIRNSIWTTTFTHASRTRVPIGRPVICNKPVRRVSVVIARTIHKSRSVGLNLSFFSLSHNGVKIFSIE